MRSQPHHAISSTFKRVLRRSLRGNDQHKMCLSSAVEAHTTSFSESIEEIEKLDKSPLLKVEVTRSSFSPDRADVESFRELLLANNNNISNSDGTNSTSDIRNSNATQGPFITSDDTILVDTLLSYTSTLVDTSASNIIAYSGGVDSSLAAALVHRVFHNNIHDESGQPGGYVKAVIGVSSSLPQRQLDLARSIASRIQIDLIEVPTTEGSDPVYKANQGQACFICKNHLYTALEAVANKAIQLVNDNNQHCKEPKENILFNGTNKDDTKDNTRLGLLAAKRFSVRSPLIHVTKDQVRQAARHLNLQNWNHAASPCLRSRLELGVEATAQHLDAVNQAEQKVRNILCLDEIVNLRVRMLSGKRAMVEIDQKFLDSLSHRDGNMQDLEANYSLEKMTVESTLRDQGFEEFCEELGFIGGMGVRTFKTGSVSRKT
mmetsp:Transcript_17782/g.20256  ORF Transcript_17782/g.20256 Transcript_17782/m.20256 type:complete len:433 (-) Transcript_17782:12-1310(-)